MLTIPIEPLAAYPIVIRYPVLSKPLKNYYMKNVLSLLTLLSLVFLSSCSPSMKITGNWMNKDMMGKGHYKKIFLFVIASDMGAKQSV